MDPAKRVIVYVSCGIALGSVACTPRRPTPPRQEPVAESAVATQRPAPVTSLTGFTWLEPFDLPSGHRAVVSVPLGATQPRPIVVGVHGAGDRAEWACGGYRMATGAYSFVVCPEGNPAGAGKFSTAGSAALAPRGAARVG